MYVTFPGQANLLFPRAAVVHAIAKVDDNILLFYGDSRLAQSSDLRDESVLVVSIDDPERQTNRLVFPAFTTRKRAANPLAQHSRTTFTASVLTGAHLCAHGRACRRGGARVQCEADRVACRFTVLDGVSRWSGGLRSQREVLGRSDGPGGRSSGVGHPAQIRAALAVPKQATTCGDLSRGKKSSGREYCRQNPAARSREITGAQGRQATGVSPQRR